MSTPTAPPQAKSYGLTNLVFLDDFDSISTIDVNNTHAAGFKWYVEPFFNSPVPSATDFSIVGSAVRIEGSTASSSYRPRLHTVLNQSYASVSGITFAGGFYVEAAMRFDPTLALTSYQTKGWPSIWMEDGAGLLAQVNATNNRFIEIDVVEAYPTSNGGVTPYMYTYDQTTAPGQTGFYSALVSSSGIGTNAELGNPDYFKNAHRYGSLWLPKARNGGTTGTLLRYFDDSLITAHTVTYTTGNFSTMETGNYVFMLEGGPSWPAYFEYAAVWKLP